MVSADEQRKQIRGKLVAFMPRIQELIPRGVIDPVHAVGTFGLALYNNPDLLKCTRESLYGAFFESVRAGLLPGGGPGETWIIPFDDSQTRTKKAQVITDYRGMKKVAERPGKVIVVPAIVYEGDEFEEVLGSDPRIHHVRRATKRTPDKATHAYCMIHYAEQKFAPVGYVLSREEVYDHRAKSRGFENQHSPWQKHELAMWLKTAIRVGCKMVTQDSTLQRLVSADEKAELGLDQAIDADFEDLTRDDDAPQKPMAKATEQVRERRAAAKPKPSGSASPQPETAETETLSDKPPTDPDILDQRRDFFMGQCGDRARVLGCKPGDVKEGVLKSLGLDFIDTIPENKFDEALALIEGWQPQPKEKKE